MYVIYYYNFSLVFGLMMVLFYGNWFLIWATLEMVSVLLISLIGQELSPRKVESISKYFVIQAVASAFLLLGIILRYNCVGEISINEYNNDLSFFFILCGLLIKIGVWPNPFWFVDVINGVSLIRGFYIAVASKIIPVIIFIIIVDMSLPLWLCVVGLGSVFMGSVLGINQTSVRKIIALSSIAHLGWLVVGLPWLSVSQGFFIFLCYLSMVVPLIVVAGFYEIDDLSNIKRGYFHPFILVFLILSLLSLGGFPPLIGFFYKWVIFLGLLQNNFYLICGFLIVMSVISLFFYLRLCFSLYSLYYPESKLVFLAQFSFLSGEGVLVWVLITSLTVFLVFGLLAFGLICL